jgi:hypothetical protein
MNYPNATSALQNGTIMKKVAALREKTLGERSVDPSLYTRSTRRTGGKGSKETHKYNGRTYKVHVGPKGGRYIVHQGNKKYFMTEPKL